MAQLELLPLAKALWETIFIVSISSVISIIAGTGLGILLFQTKQHGSHHHKFINKILAFTLNSIRSIPFIILMISILPLTRLLVGSTIGMGAAIVPLTLAATPFFARLCEGAFAEVPRGLIETAHAFGATNTQLITKVLLPESLPVLIRGATLTIIAIIGYSAMAGAVGGGGLGELAINYGYQRFNATVTIETVIILIVIVQLIQLAGDRLAATRRIKPALYITAALLFISLTPQIFTTFQQQQPALRVGVLAGKSEEVMKVAQQVAHDEYHLNIEIVTFNDYVLPNTALEKGDIDANIFQHAPYLEMQNRSQQYHLTAAAKTFVYPLGFYSRKLARLDQLADGAVIALPNDPSNASRSLLLLESAGLITLQHRDTANISVSDITSNPRHLIFKLLDAAQLPRVMNDTDMVALTNDYASQAGFNIQQAVLKEGARSPYANIIAIKESHRTNPELQKLLKVMHSRQVIDATQKQYPNGGAIPAW